MSKIALSILALAVLSMAGCDRLRPMNPGAEIEIHRMPLADLRREYMAAGGDKAHVRAWCSYDPPAIYIPSDLGPVMERALLLHEVGHIIERHTGDASVWDVLDAMHTKSFPCEQDAE